ncbi:MAG: hypothetical protein HY925_15715 [Elusimicrobia bacterium]|nr:hypothetical protein [Elusimicrobiota bacterium]
MVAAYLGVDIGGTWMRLLAIDAAGRVLTRSRARSVPRERLSATLASILKAWKLKPEVLVLGSTGFGRAADRRALERALSRLARRVRVVTDIELGWRAALGGPGVLIEAGTGSFAYGRDARGKSARVGGLGPLLGDDGSAFWIGREWLRGRPEREALAYAHKPRPQAAVASLARRVLRAAAGKGPESARARSILARAQTALSTQTRSCAGLLRFPGPVPVSWHGGLMENEDFRDGILRRLGRGFRPAPPRTSAERAAAVFARDFGR